MECKGGASELGSRQVHQQCTELYIQSIINNLRDSNKLTNDQLIDLEKLQNAFDTNKVKSYRLKQPFNDDGTLGSTEIVEFNL